MLIIITQIKLFSENNMIKAEFITEFNIPSVNSIRLLNEIIQKDSINDIDNIQNIKMLLYLTNNNLKKLKNLIYAKYNFNFKDKKTLIYFKKFIWYKNINNDINNLLIPHDKIILSEINNIEKSRKQNKINIIDKIFILLKFKEFCSKIFSKNIDFSHRYTYYSEILDCFSTNFKNYLNNTISCYDVRVKQIIELKKYTKYYDYNIVQLDKKNSILFYKVKYPEFQFQDYTEQYSKKKFIENIKNASKIIVERYMFFIKENNNWKISFYPPDIKLVNDYDSFPINQNLINKKYILYLKDFNNIDFDVNNKIVYYIKNNKDLIKINLNNNNKEEVIFKGVDNIYFPRLIDSNTLIYTELILKPMLGAVIYKIYKYDLINAKKKLIYVDENAKNYYKQYYFIENISYENNKIILFFNNEEKYFLNENNKLEFYGYSERRNFRNKYFKINFKNENFELIGRNSSVSFPEFWECFYSSKDEVSELYMIKDNTEIGVIYPFINKFGLNISGFPLWIIKTNKNFALIFIKDFVMILDFK